MSKRYTTVSSPLFSKTQKANIPKWMQNIDIKPKQPDKLDINFKKTASFADAPRVSRDGRDYNSKPVSNKLSNTGLIAAAKIELAKFLTGRYYTVIANSTQNGVELQTNITNVPATFSFNYINKKGKAISERTFSIKLADNTSGEYPFSTAGLNECLADIKTGKVKTGEKAQAYQAYTITLEEILRRFNGDQRAAMDKVHELIASEDIIGVESNTFASVYSMDSLFPQMKKEGQIEEAPTFELVNNKEHVAAKPNSSATKLIIEVGKLLHKFFDDFKIITSERKDDELNVVATVNNNGINNNVKFNIAIVNDKVDTINYCDIQNNRLSLKQLLDINKKSNLLTAYLKNNKNHKAKIRSGILLTDAYIYDQLFKIVPKDIIPQVVNNWEERKLIKRIASNKYTTKHSFLDLLNQVNVQLLDEDSLTKLKHNIKRITADIERLKQEDTGVRNDKEWAISHSSRLASLYNRIASKLSKFELLETNNDCTNVTVMHYAAKAPEKLQIVATYKGNECTSAQFKSEAISRTAKLYEQNNPGKHIFAKAIFSEKTLKNTIANMFTNTDQVISLIKKKFAFKNLGNGFYASDIPLVSILDVLDKAKEATAMNDDERKELLAAQAYFGKKLTANYLNDTGVRDDYEKTFSKSIRLANVYPTFTKFNNFVIKSVNDDATEISLTEQTPIGNNDYKFIVDYNDNQPIEIKCVAKNVTKAKDITASYMHANGNSLIKAKSIFSAQMVKNTLKSFIASENLDEAVKKVCAKCTNIGNNFYASDEPLVYLVNSNDLPFNKTYEEQKHFGQSLNRENVQDTGVRDNIPEDISKLINQATTYLANYFKDFKIQDIKIDNQDLIYNAQLFDEATGLTNTISISFSLEEGKLKEGIVNVNGQKLSLASVKKAFATNEILKKYLKYNTGKRTNAPIVFSIGRFIKSIKDLTNATEKEITATIHKLQKQGKLDQINSNLYASQYTLEQLLSFSNLRALDDDEIKKRLSKSIKNTLKRVSAAYIKDGDNRPLNNDWDVTKFTQFARSEINKLYKHADILDANLDDEHFTVKSRIDDNGLRRATTFVWTLKDGKPLSASVQVGDLDKTTKKYMAMNKGERSNIVISKVQLKQKLLGFIDISKLDTICNALVKKGIFNPLASNKYASKLSLVEIVSALAKSKLNANADAQLQQANRQTKLDITAYKADDASRTVPKVEKKLDINMQKTCDKLKSNIRLAYDEKFITMNKYNELIAKLDNANDKNDIEYAYREFKKYLSR